MTKKSLKKSENDEEYVLITYRLETRWYFHLGFMKNKNRIQLTRNRF